jgi:hypothetical protein
MKYRAVSTLQNFFPKIYFSKWQQNIGCLLLNKKGHQMAVFSGRGACPSFYSGIE